MSKYIFIFVGLITFVGLIFFLLDSNQNLDSSVDTFEEETLGVEVENAQEMSEYEVASSEQVLPSSEFIECLADFGIVIYGSSTCPYCKDLVDSLGGYDATSSLYVECSEEMERCNEEMKTNYVPEIQINGVVFEGNRTVENLAQETGCVL